MHDIVKTLIGVAVVVIAVRVIYEVVDDLACA